jgi:competence protein ComEC
VISNLLTLSVVSLVFYGIMLSCVLGLVWPGIGTAVASVVSWLIRYIKLIASAVAAIPWAAVYTCSVYVVLWLAFGYVLFLVFLLSKKKRPWLMAICALIGLVMTLLVSYTEPALDDLRVTVMDVGQGQCILFRTEEGNYLVDCGGSNDESAADTAAQTLLSQGIFRLDGIILTHYDKDHAGGVPLLLTRLDADALYLPDIADDGSYREQLSRDYGDKITWVTEDMAFGELCKFTLFAGDDGKSENESGLCVLFQGENCDILITGDRNSSAERELVERVELPQLELLVAGHHGSGSSTGFPLLSETRPEMVAISVEKDNRYGHPAEELLERL